MAAGDEVKVVTIDRGMAIGGTVGLVVVAAVATYAAGQATDDGIAHALMAMGIVLVVGGAFAALAKLAAIYRVSSSDGQILNTLNLAPVSDLVKALSSAPMWIAMIALGALLLVGSALFDGYDGFGVEVTTPRERQVAHKTAETSQTNAHVSAVAAEKRTHRTAVASQANADGSAVASQTSAHETAVAAEKRTNQTAEAQVTLSAVAAETAHARALEYVDRGVLPEGFSALPTAAAETPAVIAATPVASPAGASPTPEATGS